MPTLTDLSQLSINGDRLQRYLDNLAQIGGLPNGGVSRLAFGPEDLQARSQVRTWMEGVGMQVRVDAAGNLIGRYPGLGKRGALATGSHIDTVTVGGRYDGCLGVLAGIEVVQTLSERGIRLQHPIEVIVFTDEERSVIGSKAMVGAVTEGANRYERLDGTPIETCLIRVGGDWSRVPQARRSPEEIAAFVELHVEQGGVLENAGVGLGVVTGVVGQYRFRVEIQGRPNHAGTTPMDLRSDALVAAAQVVLAVHRLATEMPGEQVATVGYLTVSPNATNTVPGKVDLRIDLRDLSSTNLTVLIARLRRDLEAIALETKTAIVMEEMLHIEPTLADPGIMAMIESVCDRLGCAHLRLPSRAGHDAQEIGRLAKMGMIFVPSRGGISHSELEYTSPEECAQGANVLLQTFVALDHQM